MNKTQYATMTVMTAALLALTGCGNQGGGGGSSTCASATITGNGANNAFTAMAATQCNVEFEGTTLIIDLLELNDTGASPRVRFTLRDLSMADLIDGASFPLTRDDDELPEPAIYQEFIGATMDENMNADGPFWTSNAGSLDITVDDTGEVSASFDFTADNPRPDMPSTATGTVTVDGGPMVLFAGTTGGGGGCGAFGAGGIALMMMCLTITSRRMRRRR